MIESETRCLRVLFVDLGKLQVADVPDVTRCLQNFQQIRIFRKFQNNDPKRGEIIL